MGFVLPSPNMTGHHTGTSCYSLVLNTVQRFVRSCVITRFKKMGMSQALINTVLKQFRLTGAVVQQQGI